MYLSNKYIKMQRLEVSGAVQPIHGSLGVKRLTVSKYMFEADLILNFKN